MQSSRSRGVALCLASLGASVLSVLPVAQAQAAARPDLVVSKVSVAGEAVVGHKVKVSDTTKNAGTAKAGSATTAYYLSKDKVRSTKDLRLGDRDQQRLGAGAKDAGSASVLVPTKTKPRSYWVIACADDAKQVRESDESNNCRASRSQLAVSAPSAPGVFPQTPSPLAVTDPVLESGPGQAATGTYSPLTGLDLYTYATDGTSYHLQLPGAIKGGATPVNDPARSALQGAVDVTMTPLESVGGLPSGASLLAGVKLEPEGLQLANPGTLTISGPALTSDNLDTQTGFVYNADGADLSMTPVLPPSEGGSTQAGTAVLSINHFSTPGLLDASAAARAYLLEHPPARVQEQLQAKSAEILRNERLRQLTGQDPDPSVMQQLLALNDDYFDHQVVPELEAALTDDTLAVTALNDAFRWERFVMLNGGDPGARGDLITAKLPKILQNAINKAWARCATDHHLSDIMTLLGVGRFAAVLGDGADGDDAFNRALACGHFQAKVTLAATHSYHYPAMVVGTFAQDVDAQWGTQQATLDISVVQSSATVPLHYDAGQGSYSDVWKDYEGTCKPIVRETTMTSTVDGTVGAYLYLDLNAYEVPPGAAHPALPPGKLVLTFAGAKENYHWAYTSCGSGSGNNDAEGMLSAVDAAYSQGYGGGGNTIKVPISPSDQVGATLYNDVYSRTWDNQAFLHEVDGAATTITVVHTPQG